MDTSDQVGTTWQECIIIYIVVDVGVYGKWKPSSVCLNVATHLLDPNGLSSLLEEK